MKNARIALGALAGMAFLAAATPASADPATAEALFKAGSALFEGGKFNEACDKFAESYRQDAQIGTEKAQAVACEKAGRLATAWATWNHLAFDATKTGDSALASGSREKAAVLEPRLSKLTIATADAATPGLLIRRDGQDIGAGALGTAIPVDPGAHVIEATAPGYEVWQTTVTVGAASDQKIVTIPSLTKKAEGGAMADGGSPPNKTKRIVSYVVGGVGLASIGLGATMGILAASDKSSATSDPSLCSNDKCSPAGKAKIDSASTKATVSTIGFGVGIAAVGAGVFLWITSRGTAPAASDSAPAAAPAPAAAFIPSVGPQGAGLTYARTF
jgi:hypothetical protein